MIKLRICFLAALVLLLACLTACTVRVCDVCERTVIGKNYADDDFETLCKDCYATQRRMAYYGSENRDSALLEKTESADSEEAFVISQRSFTKPEQAGKFFVESLAKQDLTEALSAFCIRGCAENFDFEAYTDREGTFLPSRLLPEGTAYQPLNELYFLNKAGVSVRSFLCNLLTDYEVSQTYAVNGKELTAPEIIASFDAEQLSTLKCLRIDLSCQSVQSSEAHKANMESFCACFGADDVKEYMMLLELDDRLYAAGFSAIEYDGKWQLYNLMPMLANFPEGGVEETTLEDYLNYLK